MHFSSISALASDRKALSRATSIAMILVEDDVEVARTIKHHQDAGFSHLVVFCDSALQLSEELASQVHRVDCDLTQADALQEVANAMIAANPGAWLYYCYNAEFLFYPFFETRSVSEMLTFMNEERRDVVVSYLVDLYAKDLGAHPNGVDPEHPYFDKTGYYALARKDAEGKALDRQVDVYGGLRWRFEEHIARARQRTDRISFFRAQAGLKMLPDRSFNVAEYNTYSCPWHNNLSSAIASFRTAKALRRNPGSRAVINTFHWPQSEPFNWQSQQLLDLGLMEPGQWF